MADADQMFDDMEEYQWVHMRERGVPEETIQRAKRQKQWKDDVSLYTLIIKQRAWNYDRSCSLVEAYLRLGSALEGLVRRPEAIAKLYEGLSICPNSPELTLALAKLLFKDDQKDNSLDLCQRVFDLHSSQRKHDVDSDTVVEDDAPVHLISDEDAADAYYLGGWVKIHDDDHTNAYKIWRAGALAVPSSALLATQFRKRECWDETFFATDPKVAHLIGSSTHHCGAAYDLSTDFDFFTCYDPAAAAMMKSGSSSRSGKRVRFLLNGREERQYLTPALAIFDPQQAARGVVFRTRLPLLTPAECTLVVAQVNRYHEEQCAGQWSTVRHSSVKTTDVAVECVPLLREWLLALMHTKLNNMLAFLFPVLADGSTLYTEETPPKSRIRIHDAFIVRYDAEKDKSLSLPEHCDTSAVSVVLSLNSAVEGDYCGGGTWFEALGEKAGVVVDAEVGQAVAFAGPLKHAGFPTTQGTRMILVLFLYVEGFHYGPYLTQARDASSSSCPCSSEETKDSMSSGSEGEATPATVSRFEALSAAAQLPTASSAGNSSESATKLNSGGEKGGFVVYRQTVELVNMLEKSLVSSL